MFVDLKCKFCQRPIRVEVDDAYAGANDPFKLYALAACNPCADYMAARAPLYRRIENKALVLSQRILRGEDLDKFKETIRGSLKALMRLHADHLGVPIPDWDEEILESLCRKPLEVRAVVQWIYKMYDQKVLL